MRCRFPYGIVQENAAPGDATVELGGDETRLSLHPCGVVGPCTHQLLGFISLYGELVNQNNRTTRILKLGLDRDLLVHFNEPHHDCSSCSLKTWAFRFPRYGRYRDDFVSCG